MQIKTIGPYFQYSFQEKQPKNHKNSCPCFRISKHITRLKLQNSYGDPYFGAHPQPNSKVFFTNFTILETLKYPIYAHKISGQNSTSREVYKFKTLSCSRIFSKKYIRYQCVRLIITLSIQFQMTHSILNSKYIYTKFS